MSTPTLATVAALWLLSMLVTYGVGYYSGRDRVTESLPGLPHPFQPVGLVDGVLRFKANAIVNDLLDGLIPQDLNKVAALVASGRYSRGDYSQLMQLVGYSVSGFGDLSLVPPEHVAYADGIPRDGEDSGRDA